MKLGNLIARFPHVANLDINDEGQVMLSDAVFEAIVQNEAMRYAAARKIVSIVRHHAERLGGTLSFSYDPYHERERVFAIMETPSISGIFSSCGCAVRGKHEAYVQSIGEAVSAARAFEAFCQNMVDAEAARENEEDFEPNEDLDKILEAFEKVSRLTGELF